MKINMNVLTRTMGRASLHVRKQSPHILFAAGVAGTVGSTVLAARATLKLEETLKELQVHHNNLKAVKDGLDKGLGTVTREDYVREATAVYTKSVLELSKLYGPAVIVGLFGIACLTGSHIQLSRRNGALMAAYSALDRAYNDYRARVRQEVGEDKERDLYRSSRTEKVKNELGKIEEQIQFDPNGFSAYAKIFDELNPNWQKDSELNRIFIQVAQNMFNLQLQSKGHVFLNEVYDHLGFEHTRAGAVVGWVLSEDGDNFIDFGMFEGWNQRANMFINGEERSIVLDFNVDGVIYDKI